MFNQQSENFKIHHIGKGLYLTSNNVVIEFWKIGAYRYMKAYHKSGLGILYLDNPIKSQKEVLNSVLPFLAKYNFNASPEETKKELAENEGLAIDLSHERERIVKETRL